MVTSRLKPCDNLREDKSVARGSGLGSNNQTRLFEEQELIKKREDRGNNPRGHGRDDDESIKLDLLEKGAERREKKPKLSAYICFSLWIQFRLGKKLGPDASVSPFASSRLSMIAFTSFSNHWTVMKKRLMTLQVKLRNIGNT
jgi:hypothetical protein